MPAQTTLFAADPSVEVIHQFARLQSMTQWWHWLLLAAVCLAVAVFVVLIYRRDAFEMARAKRWATISGRLFWSSRSLLR